MTREDVLFMLGAIIGDIAGSRFEFHNHRSKEFTIFHRDCFTTDDSIMTLAIGRALAATRGSTKSLEEQVVSWMQAYGQNYPNRGYGGSFGRWLYAKNPKPYNSFGNGAAMRVSGVGDAARTLEECKELSYAVTAVTHNHPEGLKGAEATAVAIFLARSGRTMDEIKEAVTRDYYALDFTLDEIRPVYQFNETCQETVPQALEAFFESTSFEDAIRNAISIGGDSDTVGAICGGVAEAYYGIPDDMRYQALQYLDPILQNELLCFERTFEL